MREQVERLGSDANQLLPFTALLRQLKKFGRFGLLMAVTIVPLLTIEDSIATKNPETDDGVDETDARIVSSYNMRMGDIIRDTIRLGYL